ncbi:acireductone dioxygenase [Scytonema sp. UIC 10036]|uniref:cupin domain-containing protein n=1 Tax=Scytonema sp. UIC 10036 TaxID=2304196 RepID=UPI0012DA164A|nr:cupin domain-containing protein [Scytonema sp. UIC 10036]MUG99487.1 acireductone dioxygenase [Scytonema sp. UIC 10036]
MAILLLEDGTVQSSLVEISRELSPLGIYLRHYDPGTSIFLPDLISQEILTNKEKDYILEIHDSLFEFLKKEGNYLWSDLLTLHPGLSQLQMLINTYNRYHVHTAPEALYILAGEMIFGFVRPDGTQVQLLVQSQDYIQIPARVEHWSSPAASLHCKAVRYFTTADGWVPQYTGTSVISDQ